MNWGNIMVNHVRSRICWLGTLPIPSKSEILVVVPYAMCGSSEVPIGDHEANIRQSLNPQAGAAVEHIDQGRPGDYQLSGLVA
ncbi:hypothetical protein R1sor_017943 [Riccia sorocarpa]|uniref:Uncharacterized protein n=1 Tax=Riccia sorocarpa TaxID=122646 RepID=A0ABD3I8R2_9MARC